MKSRSPTPRWASRLASWRANTRRPSCRVGTACWPMGVKRLPQLSASARLPNCWAGKAPAQAMSGVPFIPARGKLHATRPNDCNASETASSKAGGGRRHCNVDADKGRTTTDWWLPFEIGGRMSVVAETARSAFAQAADRSTLELDVRDRPTWSWLNFPRPVPPSGCFGQTRTGAGDPLLTYASRDWRRQSCHSADRVADVAPAPETHVHEKLFTTGRSDQRDGAPCGLCHPQARRFLPTSAGEMLLPAAR